MAEATDSPDALGTVFERIAEQGPGADDKLFQRVDESSYPLGEWMESVHVMQMWLNTHGRVATFDSMLEYIGCAAEYADKQTVQAPLTTWTEDMLKDHGYEGNRG
jgi:hypothetical protein